MTAQQLQQQSGKGQPLQSHMDHTRTMRGTAAFVLEGPDTTHRVSAVLEVPGQPKDQSAYHSELAGLYGTTVMTTTICNINNITEGSIEVGCDGLSALKQALAHDDDVDPTKQHFDVISAIRQLKASSPIKWTTRHILGHQDDDPTWIAGQH